MIAGGFADRRSEKEMRFLNLVKLTNSLSSSLAKPKGLKKRKLGASNHRFIEAVPRAIADAEIAKDFEDSALWPAT